MNKSFFILLLTLCIVSCNRTASFKISGTVADVAEKEVIYLEYMGLQGAKLLDSVIVKKDGVFELSYPSPTYPDLYRLRMGKRNFIFPIDSTEHIRIETSVKGFAFPSKVENSYKTEEIMGLRKSIIALQKDMGKLDNKEIEQEEVIANLNAHKDMVRKLILEDPRSIVAYYALYQQVGGLFVFVPEVKEDRAYFSAVATAYKTFMPEYDRTKNIYTRTMMAIQQEQQAKNNAKLQDMINEAGAGFLDIELTNQFGNVRKLSDIKDNVILLDFSVYEAKEQTEYVFALRELYNRYATRGFEIYQISLDQNKLLWEQSTENLPWICVRDENGPRTEYLRTYNVQQVPTSFLIDKSGTIIGRNISFDKLPGVIEKCLSEK